MNKLKQFGLEEKNLKQNFVHSNDLFLYFSHWHILGFILYRLWGSILGQF